MTATYAKPRKTTAQDRCPVCGGWPGGHGDEHCYGMVGDSVAWCTRIESDRPSGTNSWLHFLSVNWSSSYGAPVAPRPPRQPKVKAEKKRGIERYIKDYPYIVDGVTVAIKKRFERWDNGVKVPGGNRFEWWALDPVTHEMTMYLKEDRRLKDMPFYGDEDLDEIPRDGKHAVVWVEGEKAKDFLKLDHGIPCVSPATGAPNIPGPAAIERLRGLIVILWPDKDAPGTGQSDNAERALEGIASAVSRLTPPAWFEEKADAADWTGTTAELWAYLGSGKRIKYAAPPEAAVAEAQELVRDDYAERRKEKLSARSLRRDGWGELVDAVLHWDKMATALSGCKQSWLKTVCNGCGTRPAFVLSCHEPLCPNCYAGRMIAHWRVQMHEIGKHERFRFLILTPNDLVPDQDKGRFKRVRERFKYARGKAYLNDGIYGVVNSRLYGQQIIWALPAACEPPSTLGSFDVELVGEGRVWDACFWFIDRYDAEIDEFLGGERPDEDELRSFIAETKQRHRYTGIGKFYPTFSPSDPSTTSGVNDEVKPVNLGLIRGGSGNGVGKKLGQTCPFCEVGRLSRYAERAGPTEIREEVHNGHTHACWVPRSDHNIMRQ